MAEPNFANPDVHVQSWYVACRSRALAPGQVRSLALLGRRIAVYRDAAGGVHAVDARCPHLGADLGQGRVEGTALRCALHGWKTEATGACRSPAAERGEARSVRAYPVLERWGIVWLFNGPAPDFALPEPALGSPHRVLRLPPQTLRCHPHLVIGNGLDVAHFPVLHDVEWSAAPRLDTCERFATSLELEGRPRSAALRRALGAQRAPISARFTAIGGSLAVASIRAPLHLDVLFTGRASALGHCETQTLLFVRSLRPLYVARALLLLYTLLGNDRRILERLDFAPDWSASDEGLRAFAETIDRMNIW
jgi:nitrite reductase/ring-hydroxylating ferredoxin subunit